MADLAHPETRLEFAERVLGHRFSNPDVLLQGFTHASRIVTQVTPADRRRCDNERLEFLGDAVLGAAIALAVYERHPTADEGWLSRAKSHLVSRTTLAQVADRFGILAHAVIGGQVGPLPPDSVKANVVEGIIGAVFIDGGWSAAVTAVDRLLADGIAHPSLGESDPRTTLQAWSLAQHQRLPQYVTVRCGGSDHAPEFASTVTAGDRVATGGGNSRKRAEAVAAQAFLESLKQP